MKKILDVRHFIIIALVIALFFLKGDKQPIVKEVIKEVPSEVVHDTIPEEIPVYIEGEDIYHDTTIYVPTLVQVDTAEILKNFYAKIMFVDTLKLNNNQGFIYLNQTVSENKILTRSFSSKIKEKIVREPAPELPPVKNQYYIGVNGALSKEDWVNSLGTSIMLKTKNDKIFQLGVGVANRTVARSKYGTKKAKAKKK